jgi:hypothetical protein
MSRTRHKDADWDLPTLPNGRLKDWQYVPIAVLMDIRDELKRLNNVLQCPNFIAVPAKLDRIERNTRKKRKRRAVGKPKLRVVR